MGQIRSKLELANVSRFQAKFDLLSKCLEIYIKKYNFHKPYVAVNEFHNVRG